MLEQAYEIAKPLGNLALECDVLSNLGSAYLSSGQMQRSADTIQQALLLAKHVDDNFVTKLVLERLGHAYFRLGETDRCLAVLEESLALARTCGDRRHEADLLWLQAVVYGDRNQREDAIRNAKASVQVMEASGNLQAPWYAEQLRRYQAGEKIDRGPIFFTLAVAGTNAPPAPGGTNQPIEGPGLLRMAFTATQAMAKFLGSGLKTVSANEVERRLRTCAVCPHYTGLRCRVCGCFTNAKARLPYEACPVGKW